MALSKNVMQGGLSSGQAQAIGGQVGASLTAAGTSQGTALALNADICFISTAAANSGVKLYAGMPGDSQIVYNAGANTVTVYPPTGAKINNAATNAGVLIAVNTFCEFFTVTTTQIIADLSA